MSLARLSPTVRDAAQSTLDYLGETDVLPDRPVDAIIGFGMFDVSLARVCGSLYKRAVAPLIIFTGGIGAGTGKIGGPEADAWAAELHEAYPDIPDASIVCENQSTNTAENIRFTANLLARRHPQLTFGNAIRRLVVVVSASRLRRVSLTLRQMQPELEIFRHTPPASLDGQHELHADHGIDYLAHLCGELDRILEYPRRGWIASESLPPRVSAAHAVLRSVRDSNEAGRFPP